MLLQEAILVPQRQVRILQRCGHQVWAALHLRCETPPPLSFIQLRAGRLIGRDLDSGLPLRQGICLCCSL